MHFSISARLNVCCRGFIVDSLYKCNGEQRRKRIGEWLVMHVDFSYFKIQVVYTGSLDTWEKIFGDSSFPKGGSSFNSMILLSRNQNCLRPMIVTS